MQPTILLSLAAGFVAAVPTPIPAISQQDQIQLGQTKTSTSKERLSAQVPIVFHSVSYARPEDGASNPVQPQKKKQEQQDEEEEEEDDDDDDDDDKDNDKSILDQLFMIFRGESLADPTTCFCAGGSMCCPSTSSEKLLDCSFGSC